MLPFGSSGDGGRHFWNPNEAAEENSDWVPTRTTAPVFNSPFYVTDQQGVHQPQVDVSALTELTGRSAAPSADNSWIYANLNPNDWQLPLGAAQTGHNALASPIAPEPSANWSGQGNAGELLGSSSFLPGGALGDTQKNKIERRGFAPERVALSRPIPTGTGNPSLSTSSISRPRASISVPPIETPESTRKTQPKSAESKTTSPVRRRPREGVLKSPTPKQARTRTSIQPNEEEQARRIHMAAFTRDPSLVSESSSQSRGPGEATTTAKQDNDLRAAESNLIENMGVGRVPGVLHNPNLGDTPADAFTLPPGKGFPIQIGSELFRLSGASIMSDSPSYFSRFFEEQLRQNEDPAGGVKTLYIDRDPATFHDICRHLQGYVIQPTDGAHYVRLFADAQFYSLPRLISQLFESETVVQIGGENFTVPRDIFSNLGDTPNFFSLGFAVFFSTPNGVYPGLNSAGLLRPPPVKPPTVPNRSARVFAEILHLLRGYPLTIRDENHRSELLRDCRYFNLKGLEQKLIIHNITYNASSSASEIVIRLEDIRQSGISFVASPSPSDPSSVTGWVHYARPYVDEGAYELILEINDEACKVNLKHMRADFYGLMKARISKLFQVIANKMNLPVSAPLGLMMAEGGATSGEASPGTTGLSEDRVKIHIGPEAFIILDGEEHVMETFEPQDVDEEMQDSPTIETARAQTSGPSSAVSNRSTPAFGFNRPASAQNQGPGTSITSPRPASTTGTIQPPPRKRKRRGSLDDFGEWIVRRGQWRLRVQPRLDSGRRGMGSVGLAGGIGGDGNGVEIVMHAVKLDAVSGQRGRNMMRSFLGDGG